MSPFRHLVSVCSLIYGLLNLTFWCVPLLVIVLTRFLLPSTAARLQGALNGIYRSAVSVNDWWFRHILGYRWLAPEATLDRNATYLVIANHQSWADSFLLQMAVVHRGPILKVLVKDELTRWPILGLIFKAYDFPRLKRRAGSPEQEPERRQQDRERIWQACEALKRAPAAMLIYPEGTRFTPAKHAAAAEKSGSAPYRKLLPPRPGGFTTVLEALRGHAVEVLDVSIRYPDTARFWQFLSGGMAEPEIRMEQVPVSSISEPGEWLQARWRLKDQWLGGVLPDTATVSPEAPRRRRG